MQTRLASWARGTTQGEQAEAILRRCVHCGFCAATCPTYLELGDERDSPRGRIYLIKQVMEGASPSASTQQHLDRCLTCRNCETTCPSGVAYGELLDLGRQAVAERLARPWPQRLQRWLLRHAVTSPAFGPAVRLAQALRQALPPSWRAKVPARRPAGALPQVGHHARQVLLLDGCAQPGMMPSIDAATIRVLDALGIGASMAPGAACCGALSFHLDAQAAALAQMRANVDAWWPLLQAGGAEALVINASGCGAMIKEYARHLRDDPDYADKAAYVVERVRDLAELIAPQAAQLAPRLGQAPVAAFHPPCTLQHWQGLREVNEQLLRALGFVLQPFGDEHLCCGSAGAYALLQPDLSGRLRQRKLAAIEAAQPQVILSANVGCIGHLQAGTQTPVRHWIEVPDQRLSAGPARA
ncbi:glycolate oxidase subunit GlcF [Bordetella trematum]|uniref:glycolate oxidase subunit GlcF n=1 Tax=Bordetella trematum TaxID=123899 RepID=UPI003AF3D2BD